MFSERLIALNINEKLTDRIHTCTLMSQLIDGLFIQIQHMGTLLCMRDPHADGRKTWKAFRDILVELDDIKGEWLPCPMCENTRETILRYTPSKINATPMSRLKALEEASSIVPRVENIPKRLVMLESADDSQDSEMKLLRDTVSIAFGEPCAPPTIRKLMQIAFSIGQLLGNKGRLESWMKISSYMSSESRIHLQRHITPPIENALQNVIRHTHSISKCEVTLNECFSSD